MLGGALSTLVNKYIKKFIIFDVYNLFFHQKTNMMRKFIVFAMTVMALGFHHSANAQAVGNVGAEGFALMDEELGAFYSGGVGFSFGGNYFIQDNLGFGAHLGGNYLLASDDDMAGTAYLIPIQAQAKFFLTGDYEAGGFHVTPQAGLQFLTIETTFLGQTETNTSGGFGFGGRVGYQIKQIDIAAWISTGKITGDAEVNYTSAGLGVSYMLYK